MESGTKQIVGEPFTVEYTSIKAWGEWPAPSSISKDRDFEEDMAKVFQREWETHKVVKRTFSPLGFQKGRLPPNLFASMGAFYYNNANHVVREQWADGEFQINWYEADCLFVQLPWALKQTYAEHLKDLVQEWVGVPIEQTEMYGMRMYTEGARLLTHVDRTATHAVSLIVNVAQGNLTEPWPVEIQDHAERMHEIVMEPGDVVYYESAKCLHGRNRPMKGPNAYFVNLFSHYRPIKDPTWFLKPNPKGTPEPVLGTKPVKDECQLVRKGLTVSPSRSGVSSSSLGYVEGVECQNSELGKHISPTLFQVHGAEDMIRWRKYTADGDERSLLADRIDNAAEL